MPVPPSGLGRLFDFCFGFADALERIIHVKNNNGSRRAAQSFRALASAS
jgi:hypothetical protein